MSKHEGVFKVLELAYLAQGNTEDEYAFEEAVENLSKFLPADKGSAMVLPMQMTAAERRSLRAEGLVTFGQIRGVGTSVDALESASPHRGYMPRNGRVGSWDSDS